MARKKKVGCAQPSHNACRGNEGDFVARLEETKIHFKAEFKSVGQLLASVRYRCEAHVDWGCPYEKTELTSTL